LGIGDWGFGVWGFGGVGVGGGAHSPHRHTHTPKKTPTTPQKKNFFL